MEEVGENGWGIVSSPNSLFPVIIIFLMEAGVKKRRNSSAVTFALALILIRLKN